MKIQSDMEMKGRLTIALNDEVVQEIENLVVTDGKEYVASRMKDATTTAMSHMAIGTDNTAAAASQTGLGTESARVTLTSTTVGTAGTADGNTITYVASFPAGTGTAGIEEAAILNASSGGIMLCRTVFPIINKSSSDSMTITWQITAS